MGEAGERAADSRVLSDATPDDFWKPGAQIANNDQPSGYSIDLVEEERLGGHVIEQHVKVNPDRLRSVFAATRGRYLREAIPSRDCR